jgi:hypothetical protein
MKSTLSKPISAAELDLAMPTLGFNKAPGLDGISAEFFKKYWEEIKADYLLMITRAVENKKLPPGVNKGLISLLHKGGAKNKLSNWRPITLLNVTYKLFAKVLQLRLQPVLMEIMNPDQSAFLLLHFILDNIFLTQETIVWADHTKQPLIFLKLDFAKAFDIVD